MSEYGLYEYEDDGCGSPIPATVTLKESFLKATLEDLNLQRECWIVGIDPGETTGMAWIRLRPGHEMGVIVEELKTPPSEKRYKPVGHLDIYDACSTIEENIQTQIGAHLRGTEPLSAYPGNIYVVIEGYRIYGHKTADHSWSPVYTIQLIGGLKYMLAKALNIKGYLRGDKRRHDFFIQSAATGKGVWTDARLKEHDLYKYSKGCQHGRDALRHALHFTMFDLEERIVGTSQQGA